MTKICIEDILNIYLFVKNFAIDYQNSILFPNLSPLI